MDPESERISQGSTTRCLYETKKAVLHKTQVYIYECDGDPDWSNALEQTGLDWKRSERGADRDLMQHS